jgi:uncharacterized protein YmfQ (DUF2313 family)
VSHKDALKLLFPADLGGDFDADLTLEGAALDAVQVDADTVHGEAYPDTSELLLHAWERICGLTAGEGEPFESRRAMVIKQLTRLGGLSIPYFVALANDLGYDVTIEELSAFMAGWSGAGDRTNAVRAMAGVIVAGGSLACFQDVLFVWRAWIEVQDTVYFRAGVAKAGDSLYYFTVPTEIEAALQRLKPAHTLLIVNYRP